MAIAPTSTSPTGVMGETKNLYCEGQSSTVHQSIRTHSHSLRVQAAAREGVAADDTQDGIDWTLAPRQTYPSLWAAPLAGKGTRRCGPRSLNSGGHTQPQQALARPWHAERQRAPGQDSTVTCAAARPPSIHAGKTPAHAQRSAETCGSRAQNTPQTCPSSPALRPIWESVPINHVSAPERDHEHGRRHVMVRSHRKASGT